MTIQEVSSQLKQVGVIASLPSGMSLQEIIPLADALLASPILAVEVIINQPEDGRILTDLRKRAGDKMLVGAAGIDTAVSAAEAVFAGAQFVSTETWRASVLDACEEHQVGYVPGIISALGATTAFTKGCAAVRLRTGGLQGPDYVRALHELQPKLTLLVETDDSPDDFPAYARAGADGVFVSSSLYLGAQQTMADFISRARKLQKVWQVA